MPENGNGLLQQNESLYGRSVGPNHSSIVRRENGDNHSGPVAVHPPLFHGITAGLTGHFRLRENHKVWTKWYGGNPQVRCTRRRPWRRGAAFNWQALCHGASISVVPGTRLGGARLQSPGGAFSGSAPKYGTTSRAGFAGTRRAIS